MGVQVTGLTLNKKCHEKEFIDFEFDGKHISEFGMVAVADGGRHSFDAAPTFQDETSNVNGVDGQYYWGTHFGSKKMSFTLATDGMTEAQVNAFKQHFKPGKYGKFIEDKLAYRYGYARISQVATFSMVPFRKKLTVGNGTDQLSFYVNEYKGDCRITFEFDDPYFYTVANLALYDGKYITSDEDGMRIAYTNNTPHSGSWPHDSECFIGDKEYYLVRSDNEAFKTMGVTDRDSIIFYNPSTAKTKGILELEFKPTFTSNFPIYINNINDDINNPSLPYNQVLTTKSILFEDLSDEADIYSLLRKGNELRYTSPDVIYSINKAIKIANDFSKNTALELEEQLRLEIVNNKVMGWAASVLRIIKMKSAYYNSDTDNFNSGTINVNCSAFGLSSEEPLTWQKYFNIFMLYMLATCSKPANYHIETSGIIWTFNNYIIRFDGIKNQASISYKYNQIISNLENFSVTEESCGDMMLSEYLTLDGGDILYQNPVTIKGETYNPGEIASFHAMAFMKGESLQEISNIKLYYTPTYL